jgi:quercetin dioxygenase-like cupin family protein
MLVLRQRLGQMPSRPNARLRNYLANRKLGTAHTVVHENVIGPGLLAPWHRHVTEEVIVVLEGRGECRTGAEREIYRAGDVVMIPARVKHPLRNVADVPLRQLCLFSDDSCTEFLEEDTAQDVEVVHAPSLAMRIALLGSPPTIRPGQGVGNLTMYSIRGRSRAGRAHRA